MPTSAEQGQTVKTFVVDFERPAHGLDRTIGGIKAGAVGELEPARIAMELRSDDCEGYIAALPSLLAEACEVRAKSMLDRSRFSTDVAFGDTARTLARHLTPVAVSVYSDAEPETFLIEATYSDGVSPFGQEFDGVDAEEAQFQALWTMTENAGYKVHEDPRRFASVMGRHVIRDVVPASAPQRRLPAVFADLIRETQAAGHSGPALDAALAVARELGLDVTPAAAPRM